MPVILSGLDVRPGGALLSFAATRVRTFARVVGLWRSYSLNRVGGLPVSELRGRPRSFESRRRTLELVRLVAAGESLAAAALQAGVKPARVLRLLDDPAFFAVVAESRQAVA